MPDTAITIGNFDGVHLGHAELVRAARNAVGSGGRVVAVFFDPHPAIILRPPATPPRLSTAQQRTNWLKRAGADDCVVIRPTLEVLRQSPEQFVQEMVRQYLPRYVVEGSDFRFGKGRAGTIETLRRLGTLHGFATVEVPPVEAKLSDQSIVVAGSTLIRWLLAHGRVRDAQAVLGRPYELVAEVVKGDQRGRTLGMPTINLGECECVLPADGIYTGVAVIDDSRLTIDDLQQPRLNESRCRDVEFAAARAVGSRLNDRQSSLPAVAGIVNRQSVFPAAISIGTKPTFGQHPRVCEAHLIGYNGPLDDYGWTVHLQFHDWLRDQLVYSDVDLLIDQLKRDVERVASCQLAVGSDHRSLTAPN